MFHKRESDVLIVGAGPVGLLTALSLVERGIEPRIIDQELGDEGHGNPIALYPPVLELLDDLGVTLPLFRYGHRVNGLSLHDAGGRQAEIDLGTLSGRFGHVLVVPRNILQDILERRLRERGVGVLWSHRLDTIEPDADGVSVTIEKLDVDSGGYPIASRLFVIQKVLRERPRFVIGADGFHSLVRRRVGIEVDAEPTQTFSYALLSRDGGLGDEARIVFAGESINAFWPVPGGGCACLLQLGGDDVYRESMHLGPAQRAFSPVTRAHLGRMLDERAPWLTGDVEASFRVFFEPALARRFGRGRVWLVGDAAHVTSPVAMQSVNAGLLEAHGLASDLARVIKGAAGPELLEGYHLACSAAWSRLRTTGAPAPGASDWVTRNAASLLACLPTSGIDVGPLARQIGIQLGA